MSTLTRAAVRLLVMAATGLICLEAIGTAAGGLLVSRGLLYRASAPVDLGSVRERPDVGWTMPAERLDIHGSRPVPAYPAPTASACVAIYGDSFAWAEEVDDGHAWGNALSSLLGCRVDNHGVVGYGPDQAYLLFRATRPRQERLVVLTHLSENVMRNINRQRSLLAPSGGLGYKPRFIVGPDGNGLRLIPMFRPTTAEQLSAAIHDPGAYLEHEWFAPGGPAGVVGQGFPRAAGLLRLAGHYKVRALLARRPSHAEFYETDHPSRGLQVSAGIATAFAAEAAAHGQQAAFVVLPLVSDFTYRSRTGRWPYAPLIEAAERAGIPVLDAGSRFDTRLDGADPCSLYVRCAGGHLNERGNQLLAEILRDWIRERRLL